MDKAWLDKADQWLLEIQNHLRDDLLPALFTNPNDPESGAFITFHEIDGELIESSPGVIFAQAEMLYTFSFVHRNGFSQDQALQIVQQGFDHIINHFWDDTHGGWSMYDNAGDSPLGSQKWTSLQALTLLALSEYSMASGDLRAMEHAINTFQTIQTFTADNLNGGYFEIHDQDWTQTPDVEPDGKQLETHIYLTHAFTNMFEATGAQIYCDKATQCVEYILLHMIDSKYQIPCESTQVPENLTTTMFGNNALLAQQLRHTVHVLDLDSERYDPKIKSLVAYIIEYGIDRESGGLFDAGLLEYNGQQPENPIVGFDKIYTHQAKAMTALLDAYLLFQDTCYLEAYENIHRFIFDRLIDSDTRLWLPVLSNEALREDAPFTNANTLPTAIRACIHAEQALIKMTL